MSIRIQTSLEGIDWVAIEALFHRAGLGGRQASKLARAYANSTRVLFIFDEEKVVGTARAISDLEYHAGIYDVAVLPEYQGQGLGRQLLEHLLVQLPVWRIVLVCDPEVENFYRKFGFEKLDGVMAKFNGLALYDEA